MLQQYFRDGAPWKPGVKLGEGVSVCFMCEDAVAYWRVLRARGVAVSRPFVGNNLWVASLSDPDGYRLDFESPTDVPEETEWEGD
jgi:lactoylglutathione lyase